MSAPDYRDLRPGHAIRVSFGRAASQVAVVAKRTPQGNVHVFKFSAKRRVWKGPIRIAEGEVIGKVSVAELRGVPVPPILPVRFL